MDVDRREIVAGIAATALLPTTAAAAPAADWRPPAPDRELRVPVRGGSIYVRLNGDLAAKKPPVLFIHGGPGSGHSGFLPALQLADARAVILYDQLDAGLSDRPADPANWTVERFVSEVDALRAALKLDRLHVVGQSWGSTIALEYAARRPAGLVSLTLGSPLISVKSWEKSTRAQLATLPADVRRTIETHEAAGTTADPAYAKAMDVFYAHFLYRQTPPAYITAYKKRPGLTLNPVVYNAMWGPGEIAATGTLKSYDGEPLLPRLAVPTLVICGAYDEMTPAAVKPLVARIPGGRLVSIPDAGHAVASDAPAAYVAAVRAHLESTDARR
ncbi:proline iminopeptidase-family hydrolase [Sphingoaurantiacus capsulatus]|uniref:Proline iminopeptidase-family hydrolase n=1 Tax=Sphingoaurantiacus capsulatus TaxID=1771310 RepID=A0ABV7X6P1_9SPHN